MAIPSQDLMMTKTCTKCRETKALEEFSLRRFNNGKTVRPYPNPECKRCACARALVWRETKRDDACRARWNVGSRMRRQRIKDAVFGAYGGYCCACCGETERAFLTLDHVDNDGARFRREQLGARTYAGYRTYAWLLKRQFPVGMQVLCMNCNHGKRMNHGVCPHQVRRNDHPLVGVEPSGSKRTAPALKICG